MQRKQKIVVHEATIYISELNKVQQMSRIQYQNTSLESTEYLKAGQIAGSPSEAPTPKVSLEHWYTRSDPSVKQNTKHSSQD